MWILLFEMANGQQAVVVVEKGLVYQDTLTKILTSVF